MGELFVKEDTGKVWIWIEKQTGVCYTDYVLKTNFICGRMKRMLRRMKRTTASLLLVAMMSVTMFEGNVYAAEDTNADICLTILVFDLYIDKTQIKDARFKNKF